MTTVLSPEERVAIHELAARYGNIIDERQFSRADEVFTTDAVYDLSGVGYECVRGVDAIVAMWSGSLDHPLAHHVTNVECWVDEEGVIRMYSKVVGVGHKGRVGSATYHDELAFTADGWRIAKRVVSLRRAETVPEVS